MTGRQRLEALNSPGFKGEMPTGNMFSKSFLKESVINEEQRP